jgi:hypothetical protein
MTAYDELRDLYKAWRDRYTQYELVSAQLVWSLASGFAKHIGAPESYPDLGTRHPKWYVYPQKVIRDENGEIHYEEPKTRMDAITRDDTGYWTSSIAVVLEQAANAYPKMSFCFFLRFIIRDRQCEIYLDEINHLRLDLSIDDTNNYGQVYASMRDMLKKMLSMQPWSTGEKSPIGFVPPVKAPETQILPEA